jgi:hypothetical protein
MACLVNLLHVVCLEGVSPSLVYLSEMTRAAIQVKGNRKVIPASDRSFY